MMNLQNTFKIINEKGIINVGGKTQTVYNFVKKNKKILNLFLEENDK